jgi:ryanodine receptor 2
MEKQKLLFHQARLANRGVAEMVLLHISACKGVQSDMVMGTLELGISILRGGNIDVQMQMLNHLKDKKEVGFFTSIAGLMNSCSVLDLDAFERNTKAEGLGVGSEGAAGEKNMHDAEFTCALFRFIQLTCEGHNLGKDELRMLDKKAGKIPKLFLKKKSMLFKLFESAPLKDR